MTAAEEQPHSVGMTTTPPLRVTPSGALDTPRTETNTAAARTEQALADALASYDARHDAPRKRAA